MATKLLPPMKASPTEKAREEVEPEGSGESRLPEVREVTGVAPENVTSSMMEVGEMRRSR